MKRRGAHGGRGEMLSNIGGCGGIFPFRREGGGGLTFLQNEALYARKGKTFLFLNSLTNERVHASLLATLGMVERGGVAISETEGKKGKNLKVFLSWLRR